MLVTAMRLPALAQSTITNVSPSAAWGGDPVTITGTGFGATQNNSYVQIGGNNLTVASWSDTQIQGTLNRNVTAAATTVKANVGGVWSNS
jgi:hypothetical protein